jgi:hypothetical protein
MRCRHLLKGEQVFSKGDAQWLPLQEILGKLVLLGVDVIGKFALIAGRAIIATDV